MLLVLLDPDGASVNFVEYGEQFTDLCIEIFAEVGMRCSGYANLLRRQESFNIAIALKEPQHH